MTGFTEAQKAELRDSIARSRVEAQDEARRIATEYAKKQRRVQRAVTAKPDRVLDQPTAWDLVGLLAETLTALEHQIADLDDDELSACTYLARLRITDVGDALARKFNRNTTSARPESLKGTPGAGAGRTHNAS